jgi:Uma2 family endonuclease
MSTALLESRQATEEPIEIEDRRGYELIDDQWVEKIMGAQSGRVSQVVNRLIDNHAEAHQLGLVFSPETPYQIFPHKPRQIRKPDGSFIRRGRLPDDKPPRGNLRIHPDLAIEVISPNDLAEEIEARIADYLAAGVPLLWVIYPAMRTVYVIRQGGNVSRPTAADHLRGEDVLPGFTCRVEELFVGI